MKADWDLGGSARLRTNLALFYDKLNNLQRSVSVPVAGSPQPLSTVTNAAKSTVYGVEFETVFVPFENFELSGYYNYLHNRYDQYISTGTNGQPIDLSGRPFRASPKNKFAMNARYTVPLGPDDSELTFGVTYTWQDDSKLAEVPDVRGLFYTQPAYGLLNGRIDWTNIGGSNVSAGAWIRNATNKFYVTGFSDLATSNGMEVVTPGEPRTYGVDMRVKF